VGLEQMSLDASLIAFGKFQLGEDGEQTSRRPINLATVATAADYNLRPTARAEEQPR